MKNLGPAKVLLVHDLIYKSHSKVAADWIQKQWYVLCEVLNAAQIEKKISIWLKYLYKM